jgi:ATPase involved in DNA replication initiation
VTAKAWEKVLAQLRGEVSEQVFETWLRPLRFVAREGQILFVATPHKFFKEWIEENHLARIEELARKELAEEVTVEIMVGSEEEDPLSPIPVLSRLLQLPEETASRTRTVFGPLNNRYTFDRFVVGTGNQFAHAASVAVANEPGNSYNPLFVYGGVGLGKTHLLHAIGNAALEKSPRLKVCYIPAEKFTNDLIASLRSGKMSDFKERYRNVDLLLMDDVQFIAGKEAPRRSSSTPSTSCTPPAGRSWCPATSSPRRSRTSRSGSSRASSGASSPTSRRRTSRRGWRSSTGRRKRKTSSCRKTWRYTWRPW